MVEMEIQRLVRVHDTAAKKQPATHVPQQRIHVPNSPHKESQNDQQTAPSIKAPPPDQPALSFNDQPLNKPSPTSSITNEFKN